MEKEIILYKDYYLDFLKKLSKEEVAKVKKMLGLLRTAELMPYHYIKYLRDDIYELRVNSGHSTFRIFFIYDGIRIIVLFNGFKKKTQKTPNREIKKAIKLKLEYFKHKDSN